MLTRTYCAMSRINEIDAEELGLIHQRVAASLITAGMTPGSAELDAAIAAGFRSQIEMIEADRIAKRKADEQRELRRAHLRVVK